MKTEYQQQMNDILAPFLTRAGTPSRFNIKYEGNSYEAFVSPTFNNESNNAGLGTDERLFKTTASITVLGYIIGEDKNQETPVVTRRESAAEITIGRERVVVGDEPDFHHNRKDKYRP